LPRWISEASSSDNLSNSATLSSCSATEAEPPSSRIALSKGLNKPSWVGTGILNGEAGFANSGRPLLLHLIESLLKKQASSNFGLRSLIFRKVPSAQTF